MAHGAGGSSPIWLNHMASWHGSGEQLFPILQQTYWSCEIKRLHDTWRHRYSWLGWSTGAGSQTFNDSVVGSNQSTGAICKGTAMVAVYFELMGVRLIIYTSCNPRRVETYHQDLPSHRQFGSLPSCRIWEYRLGSGRWVSICVREVEEEGWRDMRQWCSDTNWRYRNSWWHSWRRLEHSRREDLSPWPCQQEYPAHAFTLWSRAYTCSNT